ncbi:DUF1850 domain-containing protein [Paenibacillus tarimensis]
MHRSNALSRKYVYSLLSLPFAAVLVWWMLLPSGEYRLQIVEAKSDTVLWQTKAEIGDDFSHRYIHSVELSPVIESFTIGDGGEIIAMESRTRSFGAGLPHVSKGVTELEGGYYVMKELHEPVGELHMQPSHLHLHTFHYGEQSLQLSEPPYTRTHLTIRVEQPSRWKVWTGVMMR